MTRLYTCDSPTEGGLRKTTRRSKSTPTFCNRFRERLRNVLSRKEDSSCAVAETIVSMRQGKEKDQGVDSNRSLRRSLYGLGRLGSNLNSERLREQAI